MAERAAAARPTTTTTTISNNQASGGVVRAVTAATLGVGEAVVNEVGALGGDLKDDLALVRDEFAGSDDSEGKEQDRSDDGDDDGDEQQQDADADADDELFEQVGNCLFAAVAVYFLADARALLRKEPEKLEGREDLKHKLLDLPIRDVQVLEFLRANRKLVETMTSDKEFALYLTALQMYAEQALKCDLNSIGGDQGEQPERGGEAVVTGAPHRQRRRRRRRRSSVMIAAAQSREEVVIVDDQQKNELVYSIAVNRTRRTLAVAFRGSVTIHDWAVDARISITWVANPLLAAGEESVTTIPQRKKLGLHSGFHSYLFGVRTKKASNSKYDQILENLRVLLQKHPGFTVLVTGHSLGGALASLCSFRLALEEDIPKPVTCATFASPLTGNVALARAFQELEIQHKIVCLRVANHGDVVTQMPDGLTCCTFCCQDSIFRHVGIEMRLFHESSEETHKFRHKRILRSRTRQLFSDLRRSFWHSTLYTFRIPFGTCKDDLIGYHGCLEYLKRLYRAQKSSQSLSIGAIFGDYHKNVSEPSTTFRP